MLRTINFVLTFGFHILTAWSTPPVITQFCLSQKAKQFTPPKDLKLRLSSFSNECIIIARSVLVEQDITATSVGIYST